MFLNIYIYICVFNIYIYICLSIGSMQGNREERGGELRVNRGRERKKGGKGGDRGERGI